MPPTRRALRGRGRAIFAAALLAVAGAGAAAVGAPAAMAAAVAAPSTSTATGGDAVVVVGVAGLRWSDLDPMSTPALWSFTEAGAVGSVVTRSVSTASCPADGWLALGAGRRAAEPRHTSGCTRLEEPADDGVVPHWDAYLAERDTGPYGARLGLLGEVLEEHGRTATAVGPGAAIALASPDGVVGNHVPLPADAGGLVAAVAAAAPDTDLVVVDLGAVTGPVGGAGVTVRSAQVAGIEERVAALLLEIGGTASPVMLASLADAGPDPHLQVLSLHRFPGTGAQPTGEVLRSAATRQDGYVLATDLLPTLLEALELDGATPAGTLVGSAATGVPSPATGSARIATMVDLDRHAVAIRAAAPGVLALLLVINVGLLAVVWLVATSDRGPRPAGLRRLRTAGLAVGALPLATLLANFVPWWQTAPPAGGLLLATVAIAALLTGAALRGPWGRTPLGPTTVVAGLTALTITVDVVTGSRLQLGSVLGAHPLLAGRFYGLNNSGFAMLMVSALLVAAVAGTRLATQGRRARAVAVVAGIGLVVTFVDGMPGLGSDFGGPPALVPAFAVLALLVAGTRLSWRRLALVLLAGLLVVTAFAFLDWLRPEASRTHLGRFAQTVLDGGLGEVVGRKLQESLGTLVTAGLVLLAIAAVGALVWLLARRRPGNVPMGLRDVTASLARLGAELPAVRHAAPAAAVGLVIGLAVNDSGAAIPAVGLALGVPLVVAAAAGSHLLGARGATSARQDETEDLTTTGRAGPRPHAARPPQPNAPGER